MVDNALLLSYIVCEMEIFNVHWEGPYSFDEAISQPEARGVGVYAEYRSGSKKVETRTAFATTTKIKKTKGLYYIGKSKELTRRFGEHKRGLSHFVSKEQLKKSSIYIGVIHWYKKTQSSADISPRQLHDIETFLITFPSLKPPGNGETTKQRYKGEDIMIINTGKIGALDKFMCSNPELVTFLKNSLAPRKKLQD